MPEREAVEVVLRFPARGGIEVVAAETAANLVSWAGGDEDAGGDVRLAVVEAVVNAIEHAYGNQNCDTPEVQITFQVTPSEVADGGNPAEITILIKDQGRGFDVGDYHEPDLEQKLHSSDKRGWGLKLIRGFMDRLEIHTGRDGTTLEMTRVLTPRMEAKE